MKEIEIVLTKLVENGYASDLSFYLTQIYVLCVLNTTFLLQHLTNLLYTKRMGRFQNEISMKHFTDLILFVISLVVISQIQLYESGSNFST